MRNKSVVIILILIIGLLVGYIGYDKLVINQRNNSSNYDENTVVVSAYDGIKTFFDEAENNCEEEDMKFTSIVSIPKLVKDTNNVNAFNQKIYDEYKDDIKFLKNDSLVGVDFSNLYTFYDYIVVDDIVYIIITSTTSGPCIGSSTFVRGYYYDLKNDKELTLEEAYDKNNLALDDIVSEFKSRYPEDDYVPTGLYPIMPTLDNKSFRIYLSDYGYDGLDLYLYR